MKKKKFIFVGLLVVLITLLLAIFMFPKIKTGYMGGTTTVYLPVKTIESNTLITKDMIKEVEYPTEFINEEKVILNIDDILNKYSMTKIFDTDYITTDKITTTQNQALYEDTNLFGITAKTLASSVGGIIKPGDKVNIYGFTTEGKISFEDLQSVEVAYILTAQGEKIDSTSETSATPNVIVLKIKSPQQAKELLELEYNTDLHLERVS